MSASVKKNPILCNVPKYIRDYSYNLFVLARGLISSAENHRLMKRVVRSVTGMQLGTSRHFLSLSSNVQDDAGRED